MRRRPVLAVFALTLIPLVPLPAVATVITFDNAASLAAQADQARFQFGFRYQEAGMLFTGGIVPIDPRVGGEGDRAQEAAARRTGGSPETHYHLWYQNPALRALEQRDFLAFADVVRGPTFQPTQQPRTLTPHAAGYTVQLTYDPDGDGRLNHFSLQSLDVISGRGDVGVCRATTLPCPPSGIAVYEDLTPAGPGQAQRWGLTGPAATNILRATLETPYGVNFEVDNIEFVGSAPPTPGAQAGPAEKLPGITFSQTPGFSEETHALSHALFPEPGGRAHRWRG